MALIFFPNWQPWFSKRRAAQSDERRLPRNGAETTQFVRSDKYEELTLLKTTFKRSCKFNDCMVVVQSDDMTRNEHSRDSRRKLLRSISPREREREMRTDLLRKILNMTSACLLAYLLAQLGCKRGNSFGL